MNKNNYIRLLEEENEDLREILQLTVDGYPLNEVELLQNENTGLLKDINDLQYEWAADRTGLTKIIKGYESDQVLAEDITGKLSENKKLREINRELKEERDRFRGVIRELKKENYDLRKRLFDLEKQGVGDSESLQLFRAMEAME